MSHSPITDEELHALVDGRLDASARLALEDRLALDPQAFAKVQQWRSQRAQLRGLHTEPVSVPAHLLDAAQRLGTAHRDALRKTRYGGLAASVLLSFAIGWFAHGYWPSEETQTLHAARQPAAEFARQASLAYAAYVPEVRHPVEVGAAEQAHLVQWLSKRLGRPIKVPNLSAQGLELVGGRLLPGEEGARAQFMFQSAAGVRITLYLGGVAGKPVPAETAFQFSKDGATSSFYWVDQGFGYALSGQVPRETLLQLARAVYQQL